MTRVYFQQTTMGVPPGNSLNSVRTGVTSWPASSPTPSRRAAMSAAPSAKHQEGLDALNAACRGLYPEQPNPCQISAVVKYWSVHCKLATLPLSVVISLFRLGGPDPLDFITVYSNNGDRSKGVPSHWHYISCGLSDLYGDGRVHKYVRVHVYMKCMVYSMCANCLDLQNCSECWSGQWIWI